MDSACSVQYSTVQYSAEQNRSVQYSAVQCRAVQYSAVQCRAEYGRVVRYLLSKEKSGPPSWTSPE